MPLSNTKRFSFLQLFIVSLIVSLAASFSVHYWGKRQMELTLADNSESKYCEYNIKRITDLKFVKPILWVDENCESEGLSGTKQRINEVIEKYKQYGGVTNASVYLRSNLQWTVINENEKYEPGSLFKVPILITILKMDENNPGFLKKKILFKNPAVINKQINYASKSIKVGQSYTVKELLNYMIKYSDNEATALLNANLDVKTLMKLFTDIGIQVPDIYAKQYFFTARDYSSFMRAIFNAGYLTIPNSEYAAELLSECNFKEGILKGIPADTKIAHKFGEAGNQTEKQLHESAIVYLNDGAYLLTVMTKGKDMKKLSDLIGEISKTVYNDINVQ